MSVHSLNARQLVRLDRREMVVKGAIKKKEEEEPAVVVDVEVQGRAASTVESVASWKEKEDLNGAEEEEEEIHYCTHTPYRAAVSRW